MDEEGAVELIANLLRIHQLANQLASAQRVSDFRVDFTWVDSKVQSLRGRGWCVTKPSHRKDTAAAELAITKSSSALPPNPCG